MPTINDIVAEFIPVNLNIPAVLKTKTITANGVYNASEDNADGYSSVTVVVPDRELQIRELNITPSTSAQTFNVGSGIDVYSPINVSGVTSSIDANIQPENIKQGKTILGVEGSVVELNGETVNIAPTTSQQIIEPTSPHNGITRATVGAVTSSIDSNIQPQNIRENVTILGTTGTAYVPEYFINFTKNNGGALSRTSRMINLTGVTTLNAYSLYGAYCNVDFNNTEVDMSGVTTVYERACQNMFFRAQSLPSVDFSGVTNISADYTFYGAFYGATHLLPTPSGMGIFIDFSNLTQISGGCSSPFYQAFYLCGGNNNPLTVDFSSLQQIDAYSAFREAFRESGITTLSFPNLTTPVADKYKNYGFYQVCYLCKNLTSVDFGKIPEIKSTYTFGYAFYGCDNLVSADFGQVTQIGDPDGYSAGCCGHMFEDCTGLKNVNFSSLTAMYGGQDAGTTGFSSFYRMFTGSGVESIDFSKVTIIKNGYSMFYQAQQLQTIDLSSLVTLSDQNDAMFDRCTSLASIDLSSVTSITGSCASMFYGCTSLVTADISGVATLSDDYAFRYAFQGCSELTTVDLGALTNVTGRYALQRAFQDCPKLTTVNLSNLTTVSGINVCGYMFYNDTSLTSIDLSKLTTLDYGQYMFAGCTSLTTVNLNSLATLGSGALIYTFQNCTSLSTLSFPALETLGANNVFNNMLSGCTGVTVHFPSNLQSIIGSWSSVTSGFGGTNTTVLFDLPATE